MNTRCQQGVTLIELMVVLAITSIVVGLAAPSLNELLIQNRVSAQISILGRAITLARTTAIFSNTVITLCRSKNHQNCNGKWRDGIILFSDKNKDHQVTNGDEVLATVNAFPTGDKIFWRAFQNRQYLQMNPRGFTRYQNGTFTYCPKEGLRFARAIILNATGRIRYSEDKDNDGVDEGANGKAVKC